MFQVLLSGLVKKQTMNSKWLSKCLYMRSEIIIFLLRYKNQKQFVINRHDIVIKY